MYFQISPIYIYIRKLSDTSDRSTVQSNLEYTFCEQDFYDYKTLHNKHVISGAKVFSHHTLSKLIIFLILFPQAMFICRAVSLV